MTCDSGRLKDFFKALTKKGFDKNSRTTKFAMNLSEKEGEFEDIYQNAKEIDDSLKQTLDKK